MLHYVENHLIPGESLVSKARLSKVLMVKRIAASIMLLTVGAIIASRANNAGILLVCLPIAAALVALKWLKIQQHELAVTNRKIVAKAGLISRTVQECPLDTESIMIVDVFLRNPPTRKTFRFPNHV